MKNETSLLRDGRFVAVKERKSDQLAVPRNDFVRGATLSQIFAESPFGSTFRQQDKFAQFVILSGCWMTQTRCLLRSKRKEQEAMISIMQNLTTVRNN